MSDLSIGEPLEAVTGLLSDLTAAGVVFKHWKSNEKLALSLRCDDDLDLLVRRSDAAALNRVFASRGLRRVLDGSHEAFPAIEQYFALDPASCKWLHVDVYYAITTGSNLLKEYRLPFERLLLEGETTHLGVPVPPPGAELLALVTIQMIKRSSLLQLLTRKDARSTRTTREEIVALLAREPQAASDAEALLPSCLPQVPVSLWRECLAALTVPAGTLHLLRLGGRLRSRIPDLRRIGRVAGAWLRIRALGAKVVSRRRRHRGSKRLATGGAVVAVIGPEATGKSTVVTSLARTLGSVFEVDEVHLGKPPPTWLTWPFAALFPLLRRLLPERRASVGPTQAAPGDGAAGAVSVGSGRFGWMYALRALITAHERRALARRVQRRAANGAIIVCDRYPSAEVGAMDSARLAARDASGWRRRAADIERAIYSSIPPPTLVVQLSVALEVALERNRVRIKDRKESDQYVKHRHANQAVPSFPNAETLSIDTSGDLEPLLDRVKRAVWDAL